MTQETANTDILAIKTVLEHYFDGTHYSDGDHMAQAFAEGSQIIGKTMRAERDDWIEDIKQRTSPASQDAPYDYRIEAIDVTGGIAQARMFVPINGMEFTDVATLLKLDDGWKIIAKAFFRTK